MLSTDLSFPLDYMYDFSDELFEKITKNYIFKCDNYAVAYQLMSVLDRMHMCEHSQMVDDCFWPYSWIIFFTCRPQDVDRIACVAKRIPSSVPANIKIFYIDDDTGENVEVTQ